MKKEPRSDAWWKGYPQERLEQFAAWCAAPKSETTGPGGIQYAQEQLAGDGIKVSLSQVSRFFCWHRVNENFSGSANFAQSVVEAVSKQFPGATPEKLAAVGDLAFTAQAIAAQDAEEYREMRYLTLADQSAKTKGRNEKRKLELAERRIVLLEEKEKKAQQALGDSKLSDAEKAQRLREIFKK